MTRSQYIARLRKQLTHINQVIDYKIMHDMRYQAESRKHKLIVQRIREQTRQKYFGRLFPALF